MKRVILFITMVFSLTIAQADECKMTGLFKGQIKSFDATGRTYKDWSGGVIPDGLAAPLQNAPWNIIKFGVKNRNVGDKVNTIFKNGGMVIFEYCNSAGGSATTPVMIVTDAVAPKPTDAPIYEVGKTYIWQNKPGNLSYLNGKETVVLAGQSQCTNMYTGRAGTGWPTNSLVQGTTDQVVCAEAGELRLKK